MSTYSATRAHSKPAGVDRILVDDVDISTFRGKRTPLPPYELVEPFGYGPATITVPQVSSHLEAGSYGSGELAWVHKGAFVKIQRIDPTTLAVLSTDYRGRVVTIRSQSGALQLGVGGILEGQAELRNQQVPVYRQQKDIGIWLFDGVENSGNFPGVHFEPRLGPTTGIEITETGGMTHLGWLQHLCTMWVHKDGRQGTVMPIEPGSMTFEGRLKDTTTVHATIWLDGDRASENLVDDAAESWNTGFGTGVTKDGMIWDGTVLPLVEPGAPPPFPGTLSLGDSGAAVGDLQWKLINAHLLDRQDADGVFDQDTKDAVEQLQEDAGISVTGVVNQTTWNKLFDVDVVEWGLRGARIMPLVQKPSVRFWNYTTNGNRAGRNPVYDRNELRSDRNYDFGAGISEKVARQWMRGQRKRFAGKSWAGSLTLNGVGAFSGQHNDPSTCNDGNVLSLRDIQAGWNVWLPNFDGGTLVHVARNAISPGSGTTPDSATLDVDTHYRDALELGEVIARNRDSRRDPRREFVVEQRGSKRVHDSITPFNEKAGINYRKQVCPANEWTVFPIFAGQAGTLSKLRIVTESAPAEFCGAIFADEISAATLQRRVGNPFPVDKDGETVWSDPSLEDWFTNRLLMYAWGNVEQPGGYWPKKHTNRDRETTTAPLTGVWQDDASFGYVTPVFPALWVAIYPDRDTVIRRGRLLWCQLETGV